MSDGGPRAGERLGKYTLERLLGRGAMGSVFLATDSVLGRQVALKTIAPIYADDPHFKARFLREARTLAMINHSHVVQIYDVYAADTEEDGAASMGALPFLVTEFVDGADLHTIIHQEGAIAWRRAALLCRQTALGLGAAAARDIVHRDVKPGNILVDDDLAKVTDFGLAKPLLGDNSLTQAEVVMGTPDYMAPEQAMGQVIDWHADLYALGCTMFQMLTGRTPFGQGSPQEICACHIYEPFPQVTSYTQSLPTGLVALLDKLVQKDPQQRPASYDEVVKAFDRLLGPTRESGQRRAFLIVEAGRQLGLRIAVGDRPVVIGRLPDCDLSIDDARSSRRHATVQPTADGIEVRDLGSRNGIYVNGQQVPAAPLSDGDRFIVGDTVFRFELPEPAPPSSRRISDAPLAAAGAIPAPPELSQASGDASFDAALESQQEGPGDTVHLSPQLPASDARAVLARAVSPSAVDLFDDGLPVDEQELTEHRLTDVAVVRFNLTGTVRLLEQLSAKEVAALLQRAMKTLVDVVFSHRGCVDNLTADSLLVVFNAPVNVPDPVGKAASAALEGVAAVAAEQTLLPPERRFGIRAGVSTGTVLAGVWGPDSRRDFGVVGATVDIARSLGALAPAGGVLVTEEVHLSLGEHRSALQRSEQMVKLHGREVPVYELQPQRIHVPVI